MALVGTCADTGIADANGNEIFQDDAGNQWYGDSSCGGGSSSGSVQPGNSVASWVNSLGGLFGTVFHSVNPQPVVAGRGIPGSPASLAPVSTKTGVGTLLVIGLVALLVWMRLKPRR